MIDLVTEVVPPLGLARYRALFQVPHVRRLVLSGLLARLPMGMVGLALLLLVRERRRQLRGGRRGLGRVLRGDRDRSADRRPAGRPARPGADPPPSGADLPCPPGGVCALALLDAPLPADRRLCRGRRRAHAACRLVAARAVAAAVRRRRSCAPLRMRSKPRCRRSPSSSARCSSRC